jgi:hypothetical protein
VILNVPCIIQDEHGHNAHISPNELNKDLSPDLPRGRGKSISGDLNIDNEASKQNVEPL